MSNWLHGLWERTKKEYKRRKIVEELMDEYCVDPYSCGACRFCKNGKCMLDEEKDPDILLNEYAKDFLTIEDE